MPPAFDSMFEEQLVSFLKQKGYPKDSIIYQPTLLAEVDKSRLYRPDFAIIDPQRQERLAIVEVKGPHVDPQKVAPQLTAYQVALADKAVEYYLMTPVPDSQSPFTLYRLTAEGKLDKVPFDQFPQYATLVANKIAARKETLDRQYDKAIDYFKITCFILAGAALLVGIMDFILSLYAIHLLTAERLAVLGASIALVIIPFAAKFKGFGIEYERYIEAGKRHGKD